MLGIKRPREESGLAPSDKRPRPWQAADLPNSAADHHQTLHFRAPALTPIDSSDDEMHSEKAKLARPAYTPSLWAPAHRPPPLDLNPNSSSSSATMNPESLLAGGDQLSPWPISAHSRAALQPSPIPHTLVNHSLNISTPTVSLGMEYRAPQPPTADQVANADCMEDMEAPLPPTTPLPSPVSDDAMNMGDENRASSDTDMVYHSPGSSSPAAVALSADLGGPSSPLSRQAGPASRKIIMGYRADCEKCRRRVPGHYIHIRS